ncbi:coiled-coil domain-containing protein 9B [Mixophyes fleayi]|uniref:coiled-coil domain-containing protein 9B n=1 Tax=Mixophyes fleayi TaxID=3061075 RepID=UPI003F4DB1EC
MAERPYYCVESEFYSMEDGQRKVLQSDGEIGKKEQKDLELDNKINAIRIKNKALVRRYQEVEEDRRNAEKKGMAITSLRPKKDSLTITITKTSNGKRIVSESLRKSVCEDEQRLAVRMGKRLVGIKTDKDSFSATSKMSKLSLEEVDNLFTLGRGRRMQIGIEIEKGKKFVGKKNDQDCFSAASKMTMEEVDNLFTFGRGRRMQIGIEMEKKACKRKAENKPLRLDTSYARAQNKKLREKFQVICSGQPLTLSAQRRIEYLQWKKEREQIDLERLARHKNSKGEWQRAWDVEKPEDMFENSHGYIDTVPFGYCGRRGRDMTALISQIKKYLGIKPSVKKHTLQDKHLTLGDWGRNMKTTTNVPENKGSKQIPNDNTQKIIQTRSRSAKGKDRLTGRAQSWYSVEGEDFSYSSENYPMQKGVDNRDATKHSEGDFCKDQYLNTEKPKLSVQNDAVLLENQKNIQFDGENMEEICIDLPSKDIEVVEYPLVLNCERDLCESTSCLSEQSSHDLSDKDGFLLTSVYL